MLEAFRETISYPVTILLVILIGTLLAIRGRERDAAGNATLPATTCRAGSRA